MPLYDVCCFKCDHTFEHFCSTKESESTPACTKCGGPTRVVITNHHTQDWFKPHINENFTGEPIEVRSRSHLKQLCDQHGMISRVLGDHRNIKEL